MKKFIAVSLVVACSAAYGSEIVAASNTSLSPPEVIVFVDPSNQNWIVVTEKKYEAFKVYVKWEFNCADSTARFLGSSNSVNDFKPDQQDKYFSQASDISKADLLGNACKTTPMSVSSNQ